MIFDQESVKKHHDYSYSRILDVLLLFWIYEIGLIRICVLSIRDLDLVLMIYTCHLSHGIIAKSES